MCDHLINQFKKAFGTPEICVQAPARVNIIGEHTDYNNGFVLPFAADKYMYLVGRKTNDDAINIYAFDVDEKNQVSLSQSELRVNHWSRYFQGVINILLQKNFSLGGLDILFGGDIPIGAGMSSSSSLTCGFLYLLNEVFQMKLTEIEIIHLASDAENSTGLQGGKMDQYAITLGKKDHALFLDCKNFHYQQVPMDLVGYSWVLWNTNVKHNLVDSEYNNRRKDCERGLYLIEENHPYVQGIEDILLYMLPDIKDKDPIAYNRLLHVVQENQRVKKANTILKNNQIENMGKLLLESHISLRDLYEVSCPELDFLVENGSKHEAFLGGRMMGGGFGGCTINLIKSGKELNVFTPIKKKYDQKFKNPLEMYVVFPVRGITKVF